MVLGAVADGSVNLVANFSESAVKAGARADEVVRTAAGVVGGGGGGRDTMARAGRQGPGEAARGARGRARGDREGDPLAVRVLALDHGEARCGCALSDPSGTLATPLGAVERPDSERGLERIVGLVEEHGVEQVVVGLPLTLAGEEGGQAALARAFAERLAGRVSIPVDLYDERLTTRMAERGGEGDPDSRAAAHLLESWLQRSATR